MKEIHITQGQVALVDDEDFDFLNQWKWHVQWSKTGKCFYAIHTEPEGHSIIMSRLIMNTPKNMICDHIDHNTLNNQKYNLRNVTQAQNQMNRRGPQINNMLGILGISKNKQGFRGRIAVKGKGTPLPTRKTIEEAIADRKSAEENYYGDYRKKDNH